MGGGGYVSGGDGVGQVDEGGLGSAGEDDALHDGGEGVAVAEVGEEDDGVDHSRYFLEQWMTGGVGIDQLPDHLLIGGMILLRGLLEELDARLAQRHGHLHALFLESQLLGRG